MKYSELPAKKHDVVQIEESDFCLSGRLEREQRFFRVFGKYDIKDVSEIAEDIIDHLRSDLLVFQFFQQKNPLAFFVISP